MYVVKAFQPRRYYANIRDYTLKPVHMSVPRAGNVLPLRPRFSFTPESIPAKNHYNVKSAVNDLGRVATSESTSASTKEKRNSYVKWKVAGNGF
jgi:hypothetical protein